MSQEIWVDFSTLELITPGKVPGNSYPYMGVGISQITLGL